MSVVSPASRSIAATSRMVITFDWVNGPAVRTDSLLEERGFELPVPSD